MDRPRDHAILLIALQTGLRASELIGLRCRDVVLGTGAHIRCDGKGRKERCTPLRRDTVSLLERWLRERRVASDDPLFPSIRGDRLSRDALEHLVRKHSQTAAASCHSLAGKRVSPHILRHSTAMELLQHGVDQTAIALWFGHESVETTQIYIHADMRMKEKALSRVTAPETKPGRYRPDDKLLAFLEALRLCRTPHGWGTAVQPSAPAMWHNPSFGIMPELVQRRAVPVDWLEIGLGRRDPHVVLRRHVVGAVAADAEVDADRLDQHLYPGFDQAGRRRWRDRRDLLRQVFALRGVEDCEAFEERDRLGFPRQPPGRVASGRPG